MDFLSLKVANSRNINNYKDKSKHMKVVKSYFCGQFQLQKGGDTSKRTRNFFKDLTIL